MSILTSAGLSYAEAGRYNGEPQPEKVLSIAEGSANHNTQLKPLQPDALPELWLKTDSFCIADTCFAAGLDFLLTVHRWLALNHKGSLHYVGIENTPACPEDIRRAAATHPELPFLAEQLLKRYPPPLRGWHRVRFPHWNVTLDLIFGDTEASIKDISHPVDAWYSSSPIPKNTAPPTPGRKRKKPASALVIGAGLAGSAAAAALARQGVLVTVLESNAQPADAASGNPVAVLQGRYHRKQDHLGRWSQAATRTTLAELKTLNEAGLGVEQLQCGSVHMLKDADEQQALAEQLQLPKSVGEWLSADDATTLANAIIPKPVLWQPEACVVNPAALTKARLASNPLITTLCDQQATTLNKSANQWQALNANGETLASADIVVLATGATTNHWLPWLPLQLARGQLTAVPATEQPPKTIIGYGGQLMPPIGSNVKDPKVWLGATAARQPLSNEVIHEEHQTNLARLEAALPELHAALNSTSPTGRAAIRCKYLDHLPIGGHISDGIYVSTAHGARGLSNSSLCGEIIAGLACGTPPPLSLIAATDPLRAWRRLKKKGLLADNVTPLTNTPIHLTAEHDKQ